jgi:hypothetical protein
MRRSGVALSAPTGAHVGWKFETLQLFPQKQFILGLPFFMCFTPSEFWNLESLPDFAAKM